MPSTDATCTFPEWDVCPSGKSTSKVTASPDLNPRAVSSNSVPSPPVAGTTSTPRGGSVGVALAVGLGVPLGAAGEPQPARVRTNRGTTRARRGTGTRVHSARVSVPETILRTYVRLVRTPRAGIRLARAQALRT